MAAKNSSIERPQSDLMSDSSGTNLSQLPDEIKLRILHYVDNQTIRKSVTLVNKEFNNLAKDYTLYESYETPDFDSDGLKTVNELNHCLYKSYLKVLSTNIVCLRKLDLVKFTSLEKIILYNIRDTHLFFKTLSLPQSITNIEVRGEVYPRDLHGSVQFKLDVLRIEREEELRDIWEIPADRYLINVGAVSCAEDLQSLRVKSLSDLLEMNNIVFYANYWFDEFTNMLSHVPGKLVKIEMEFDCSDDYDMEVMLNVCRHCISLEHLKLLLYNVNHFPTIESVKSEQIKTLILAKPHDGSEGDVMRPCELLIRATRQEFTISRFNEVPLEMLTYLNPSLSSLTMDDCTWSSDNVVERKLISNLTLDDTPAAPILESIDPRITKLNLIAFDHEDYVDTVTALESMHFLEVFVISASEMNSPFTVNSVLEALLSSKDSLRIFKFLCQQFDAAVDPDRDERRTLQLLNRFEQLQHFEIESCVQFTRREVQQVFPTAIVYTCVEEYGSHTVKVFL